MNAPTLQNLMQHALSLVHVGLAIGGVIVMALHLNLSKWMWAPLIGFLIQALVSLAYSATTFGIQMGTLSGGSASAISAIYMVLRAAGLLGWLLIVGGLWGVLSDVQRRLAADASHLKFD